MSSHPTPPAPVSSPSLLLAACALLALAACDAGPGFNVRAMRDSGPTEGDAALPDAGPPPDQRDYYGPEVDSDGDTIADRHEGRQQVAADSTDTDADRTPDYLDGDSDRDGLTDRQEAGDDDVLTPPVDTDGDRVPDYRDPDSDGDGLADRIERELGTDVLAPDTDGDGAPDVLEHGTGTDALDPNDHPRARGDFVFLVPYEEAPSPERDGLSLSTDVHVLDVYFLMDSTSSMTDEIVNLANGLSRHILPSIRAQTPDTWFGVGGFEDYPLSPYGSGADRPFYQYQTMTSSISAAQNAVNRYSVRHGNDGPESHVPALWSLVTGGDLGHDVPPRPGCVENGRGYACFRQSAVPVIVVLTDAPPHNFPGPTYGGSIGAPTWDDTLVALRRLGVRIVGVDSGGGYASGFLREAARSTGTVDTNGSPDPYVFSVPSDGTGLDGAVVDAILAGANAPVEISARVVDLADATETVDAAAAFVDRVEPSAGGSGLVCTGGLETMDRPGFDDDEAHDTFRFVPPGSPVCFDIVPRMNTTVAATETAQLFRGRVEVLSQGANRLDEHIVYFLVPPRVPDPAEDIF